MCVHACMKVHTVYVSTGTRGEHLLSCANTLHLIPSRQNLSLILEIDWQPGNPSYLSVSTQNSSRVTGRTLALLKRCYFIFNYVYTHVFVQMSAKIRKRPHWISGTGVAGRCEPCDEDDWNWTRLFCKDIRDPSQLNQLSSPRVLSHMGALIQIQVTIIAQQGFFLTKPAF